MSVSRRDFVKMSGAAMGIAVAPSAAGRDNRPADRFVGAAVLPFARKPVGRISGFPDNVAVAFSYPDADSPCAVVKMSRRVPGGVGPDGDLVAFSTMCAHMGCPVTYNARTRNFDCPCHYTMFDAELAGQMICGHATENLPQIVLEYEPRSGMVYAVGVSGKLYGRQANVI